VEIKINVPNTVDRVPVYGTEERNLKMIREGLGVNVLARNGEVRLTGEAPAVDAARQVVNDLIEATRRGKVLDRQQVLEAISHASWSAAHAPSAVAAHSGQLIETGLDVSVSGRRLTPASENQRIYLESMIRDDLVFGIGPAGTGKTYLAVAVAVHLLRAGRFKRALLARPAVEAGEKLGYLPGDQFAKVNPYLRPLLDALSDMLEDRTLNDFLKTGVIEVVPLAFMRGRTLNDAIIILDEAQNTTRAQMQMFLTRMGQRSKMIVTGDITQIDLEVPSSSGLIDAAKRLRGVPGASFCHLDKSDVVRHPLVQSVIEAYTDEEGHDHA
jgi:phosphate starvation-inducible PhoH-like protein